MAADRGAALTIRAAVRGVIDFRQARVLDPHWWRLVRLKLDEMERADQLELDKMELAYYQSFAANPTFMKNEQASKSILDAIDSVRADIRKILRPWSEQTAQAASNAPETLADEYRATLGDPRDPEFKRQMYEDIRRDDARRAVVPDDPEQRLQRQKAVHDAVRQQKLEQEKSRRFRRKR